MLSSVLALCTAAPGAVLTAAALDSAAAAVAGAASTVIINGEGPYEEFWSKIPSTPSSYTPLPPARYCRFDTLVATMCG